MRIRKATLADAQGAFQVRVKSWQTSYAGILPARYLAGLDSQDLWHEWQGELEDLNHGKVTYVAENQTGQVIGFASGGPERNGDPIFSAELYAIYLLGANQHRGIGSQLFQSVARDLNQAGHRSMLVWALSANPTRSFYEKLGGEVVDQKEIEIAGGNFTEVAYGWRDIRPLTELGFAAKPEV
ncbi:MAG TPA: GNAT family N-acetyltransferase [Anaerolineaceae bacterium]|jgi:L-amino acid N-acyltransferase YncA